MSDSGSSSSQIGHRRRLRPRTRPLESETSDESPDVLRKKVIKKRAFILVSSESDSEVEARRQRRKISDTKSVIASDSESETDSVSDGTTCPICLEKMCATTLQGRSDSCAHRCCLDCIITWSKKKATCVLCRQAMTKIKVILRDEEIEEVPVKRVVLKRRREETIRPIDPRLCVMCQSSNRKAMVLCCFCNEFYHRRCLTQPPPSRINSWICPACQRASASDIDDEQADETFVPHENGSHRLFEPGPSNRSQQYFRSTRSTTAGEQTVRRTRRPHRDVSRDNRF